MTFMVFGLISTDFSKKEKKKKNVVDFLSKADN